MSTLEQEWNYSSIPSARLLRPHARSALPVNCTVNTAEYHLRPCTFRREARNSAAKNSHAALITFCILQNFVPNARCAVAIYRVTILKLRSRKLHTISLEKKYDIYEISGYMRYFQRPEESLCVLRVPSDIKVKAYFDDTKYVAEYSPCILDPRRRRAGKHCPITFTGTTAFMLRSEDAAEMY